MPGVGVKTTVGDGVNTTVGVGEAWVVATEEESGPGVPVWLARIEAKLIGVENANAESIIVPRAISRSLSVA